MSPECEWSVDVVRGIVRGGQLLFHPRLEIQPCSASGHSVCRAPCWRSLCLARRRAPPPPPSPPQSDSDLTAVRLGVAIDARAANGAPRLVRAIVPRAGAAGMTADEAARDHLAALTPLWLTSQRPADLATRGVQRLRN